MRGRAASQGDIMQQHYDDSLVNKDIELGACQEIGDVVPLALDDLLEASGRRKQQPSTDALVHQISREVAPSAAHRQSLDFRDP